MSFMPLLILTLRRSGGTSFTRFLTGLDVAPQILAEPFNPDRIWGEVTLVFRDGWDRAALAQAVAARLDQRLAVKHCVETVPPGVTEALIAEVARRGWPVIVLQRGDEAARLRSLHLALASDAWGPAEAARLYPAIRAGEAPLRTIDLALIQTRANQDRGALGQALLGLRARAIRFHWLLFEDMVGPKAAATLREVAAFLGRDLPDDHPALLEHLAHPGQDSGADLARLAPGGPTILDWIARRFPS